MPVERRSYDQFCAVARALDLVGERWTLLLIREFMLGPRRFKDLLAGLPGIGTNLLTERLRTLEQEGVIRRHVLPPPAGSTVYELTDIGRGLEPVVFALGRWGHQFLDPRAPGQATQPGWFIVSLRARFDPVVAKGIRETYQLLVDGEQFEVRVDHGAVRVTPGPATAPAVALTTGLSTFYRLLVGATSPAAALRSKALQIDGDAAAFERFVALFAWSRSEGVSRTQIGSPRSRP